MRPGKSALKRSSRALRGISVSAARESGRGRAWGEDGEWSDGVWGAANVGMRAAMRQAVARVWGIPVGVREMGARRRIFADEEEDEDKVEEEEGLRRRMRELIAIAAAAKAARPMAAWVQSGSATRPASLKKRAAARRALAATMRITEARPARIVREKDSP